MDDLVLSRRRALLAVRCSLLAVYMLRVLTLTLTLSTDRDFPLSLIRSLHVRHRFWIHPQYLSSASTRRDRACAGVALGVAVPVPCPRISVRMRMQYDRVLEVWSMDDRRPGR